LGRPVCDTREGSWVRGLLKPNGPNAEGSSRPSGQKLRKEKTSISFPFSNIPIAFSDGFWNHFLLEIKPIITNKNMQQHVYTSKYLTLLLILFIENYFSRLKCSQNCGNKFNSPILK
jgi:hypothetical protein